MRIVIIGGSGLIGTKLVNNLRQLGHEVVAASRSSGVNTLTGEGLAEVLTGAEVVVDGSLEVIDRLALVGRVVAAGEDGREEQGEDDGGAGHVVSPRTLLSGRRFVRWNNSGLICPELRRPTSTA